VDDEPASSKLLVAFLAIHALSSSDIRLIRLDDVDLPLARITVRRPRRSHVVFLDPLTYQLLTAWLRERRDRWPLTRNPYLIINLHTACDDRRPPIAVQAIRHRLRSTGLLPKRLRSDRILHEAAITADPVHLIRLFGVSVKTAMRYLRSAHPERGSVIPR
jgi:integrase